jgi:S-phase kinase-associated protein 1
MASTDEQKIILVSSDGVNIQTGMRTRSSSLSLTALLTHVTDRIIAERSMLIKNMIEDLGTPGEEPIPIMNVSLLLTVTPHPTHTDASSSGL